MVDDQSEKVKGFCLYCERRRDIDKRKEILKISIFYLLFWVLIFL